MSSPVFMGDRFGIEALRSAMVDALGDADEIPKLLELASEMEAAIHEARNLIHLARVMAAERLQALY